MFKREVVLAGTVVIEGAEFRWSATDGLAQRLTVTHPLFGTETRTLTASPDSQARDIGRQMLQQDAQRRLTDT